MRITVLMGVLVTILTGCHAPSKQPQCTPETISATQLTRNIQPVSPDIYQQTSEVVRHGRYLLVSTDPTEAQRDLLSQLVDVRISVSQNPTVADALRYVLRQSGYSLCTAEKTNDILYRQPLPSVHYQLAPIRLRTALQFMAGPAWQLEVDEVQREVCHHLRPSYQLPQPRQGKQP
ncbi:PilL N-terminal domain-containing protein [Xenorhabdus koppenhoeferi]|uniref:Type IV pili sensor histidine kinase and response regulator n=1 Tax=Xenorhabdus koppenhoeferi TaxID=351659 RepID=A0A1I7H1V1_9GAMM|nr:PilL N-terminal domain-containing protein [Xenorhabdus koppenhoeferi]SFU54677.1 type IV pili sensor histidine kinase and response regulator [Xenorhabdus koppenhoeferi]